MKAASLFFLACYSLIGLASGEVPPVKVQVPDPKAWVGQRLPFFVNLNSKGSFAGTASFDLPQIPGALVIKIGDPVVDTQEFDGEEWFVQKHEFALFSQKAGKVKIPSFPVRFAQREGFSGPASDVQAQTTDFTLEIERPPGSEKIGFLVTTETITITETWDPQPGSAEIGAIFKRTITQKAEQLPGMALAPAPTGAPDGIRVYPGSVVTKDNFYRGAFTGERSETTTYLLQKSGSLTLPGLTYTWWNPKTKELQSKTLPAVTFEVAAPPVDAANEQAAAARRLWPWLLVLSLIVGLVAWQRKRIAAWGKQCWRKINPPDRIAARKLLHACREHDAAAAENAWTAWRNTQNLGFQPDEKLQAAVLEMQRTLFGPISESPWQGEALARIFTENLSATKAHSVHKSQSSLPLLNPRPRLH